MKCFIPPNRNSFIRISFVFLIYNSLQRMVLQPLRVTYSPAANVPLLFCHHDSAADDKRSTLGASLRYEIQNCHAIVWISHKSFFRGASRGWPLNIDFTELENKCMKKKTILSFRAVKFVKACLRTSLCKNQTSWEMKIFNPPSNFAYS